MLEPNAPDPTHVQVTHDCLTLTQGTRNQTPTNFLCIRCEISPRTSEC